jgi:microcystin-dependent protein
MSSGAGNLWARNNAAPFAGTPNNAMHPQSLTSVGGGQPHDNMPPYLVLNFVIALVGIFPTRN